MMKRRHIFLTGFMGSGKSTVGPLIAEALGFSFIDLDDVIERSEGKTIDDIFQVSGEQNFRVIERSYIRRFVEGSDTVFALGGGTVTIEGLIPELKLHGILVYLKSDADALVPRLRGHSHRPLLLGMSGETLTDAELQQKITFLLKQREEYYRQADVIVDITQRPVDAVVESVLNAVADNLFRKSTKDGC
jgi:shikimate kinase